MRKRPTIIFYKPPEGELVRIRGVMIPTLDPDPELDFKLFNTSRSRFGSSKKRNRNTYRYVMILVLDLDLESDFLPFGDS